MNNSLSSLVMRNIKVYYRDKVSVFFSFLSILIIIMLYALFLGNIQVDAIKSTAGDVQGIRYLVDTWIMAGIIAISSVTISLGALGTMVDDQHKKILRDFVVAPIKKTRIVASYILSTWIIALVVGLFTFVLAELYIFISGGEFVTFPQFLKILGIMLLCIFSSASIMFFIASFIKTANAFATLSTIVGTMIGFLAGIYVPMGVLPSAIQTVIKFVPVSHGAVLLRQVLMEKPLDNVFAMAPAAAKTHYMEFNGVMFKAGDSEISVALMLLVLAGSGLLFFILSVFRASRMKVK